MIGGAMIVAVFALVFVYAMKQGWEDTSLFFGIATLFGGCSLMNMAP